MECHGDDILLTFHDTPLSSLLVLLAHVSKFNVNDTYITKKIIRLTYGSTSIRLGPYIIPQVIVP